MKKVGLALVLGLVMAGTAVFADHPGGWGVGVVGGYSVGVMGGGGAGPGFGLSLKIPSVPVFWGIGLGFGDGYFGLNVTGDYYLKDQVLVSDANLHWFFGVGGFFDFFNYSKKYTGTTVDYSYTHINFGARLPIGLSWQPIELIELFINVAPSLGVNIYSGYDVKSSGSSIYKEDGKMGLFFGVPLNLGLRFWF